MLPKRYYMQKKRHKKTDWWALNRLKEQKVTNSLLKNIRFFLLILILLQIANIAKANEFDKHPIYKQIVTNKPNIDRKYAMNLSNIIHRKAKQYDISANLMTAIFMQESSYISHNHAMYCGVEKDTINYETCVIVDFGMGQINYRTAKALKLDLNRLKWDMEYNIDCSFKIMKDFKNRYFKTEYYWWTRYNSSTPSYRNQYRENVQRWM